ncbi:uncharacterized protein SCHCODRAFT_02738010 [Schizophyllum commune H4-8]|uniref:uncharacterized protein n=1 Tax=Schizophyllum commune (strain H4-8 / FGSC 9210) TaxID=578458 RepID=UPI00215EF46C|nr:uncharacterized protein SCHCODRAFT_02738010 [Schizophyllum commune H4-8]KAI5890623.1 hypothetical protein SCHCODRAFT_02738010 [Schizophyllum commune H4-8]
MSTPPKAYIREAKLPQEFGELSTTASRAFASHPLNTYWSNQKVAVHLQEGKQKEKSLRELARLLESTLRFVWLTGGRIMVVAVPDADGKEHLAAGAAWSGPDSSEKASLLAVLRAKFYRPILDWGLAPLKRGLGEYLPVCDRQRKEAARKYGVEEDGYWYLELLFTNPDDEGRGHGGKLLREMDAYAPDKIFMLHASTERTIAIYNHKGWKTCGEDTIGVGKAAEDGTRARGEKAKGVRVVLMLKVSLARALWFPALTEDDRSLHRDLRKGRSLGLFVFPMPQHLRRYELGHDPTNARCTNVEVQPLFSKGIDVMLWFGSACHRRRESGQSLTDHGNRFGLTGRE